MTRPATPQECVCQYDGENYAPCSMHLQLQNAAIEEAVEEARRTQYIPPHVSSIIDEEREKARQAALHEALDEVAAFNAAGEAIARVLRKKLGLAP